MDSFFLIGGNVVMDFALVFWSKQLNALMMDLFLIQACRFSLHKTLIDVLESCG